MKTASFTRNP